MLTKFIKDGSICFADANGDVLTIREQLEQDQILITLQGELRSETALLLQDELESFLSLGLSVTLDFSGVTFLSHSALYTLLGAQQFSDTLRRGQIILKQLPASIYQEFDRNGLTELLQIE